MYWVFETKSSVWRRQSVHATLVTPKTAPKTLTDCGYGFRGPQQLEPYGVDLCLTYRIDSQAPTPDNFSESFGFRLFSRRLIKLLHEFGVCFEAFPVTMIDKQGRALPYLDYSVFHLLEKNLDAMDEERSSWTGDFHVGILRLVLDLDKFEHRPLFWCDKVFVPLMRDDLKTEIQRRGITGFGFLLPERYRSGEYGFPPDFDD
jgi:hypothetical protein